MRKQKKTYCVSPYIGRITPNQFAYGSRPAQSDCGVFSSRKGDQPE